MNKKFKGNMGIICDIDFKQSLCFINYYRAVKALFPSTKLVRSVEDLKDVDFIFCGNEYWAEHMKVWRNEPFINECNRREIKVFIYTAERIFNLVWPTNIFTQRDLQFFRHLIQRTYDVVDTINLKTELAHCSMSRHYADFIPIPEKKLDRCVFVGQVYAGRQKLFSKITIPVDIISGRSIGSREDYLKTLAQYRFVLSPHADSSNSLPLRFYESLLVGSIPIQQVYDDTLKYYTQEAQFPDVIYFNNPEEIKEKVGQCSINRSYSEIWLEDELESFFSKYGCEEESSNK